MSRDTKARNAAKQRYNAAHYDQLKIYVAAGSRDIIADIAYNEGYSIAEYVRHCIISDATARGYEGIEGLIGGGVISEI